MRSGELIKKERENKGLTQTQLGDKVGITRSMLSQIESGKEYPALDVVLMIASELNLEAVELVKLYESEKNQKTSQRQLKRYNRLKGLINPKDNSDKRTIPDGFISIPILGSVPAGPLQEVLPKERFQAIGSVSIPENSTTNPDQVFALYVSGESMIGKDIKDGDIVVVDPTIEPVNGNIVVAMINNEATVKTFYKTDKILTLQSENPNVAPIALMENEMDRVKIIGKVIWQIRKK